MAATVTTKEYFEKTGDCVEQLATEIKLRLQAGAITSKASEEDGKCLLTTEWNVFGQQ